jgi:C1A family cysteine protease
VCVDASNWSQYRGGILSTCGTSTNHAVTAFGYDNGFWLIKNSWGTQWGEGGYIRIKDGNTCNVLSESYLAA